MTLDPLGDGQVSLVWKAPLASQSLGCALEFRGTVTATGYADGAAILVATQAYVELPKMSRRLLGAAGPVGARADSYPTSPGQPRDEPVVLVVPISAEAVNRIEESRHGGPVTIHLHTTLFLAAAASLQPGTSSTREVQETMMVDAPAWQVILQQWGRGAAIPLFVSLPQVLAGEDQSAVVQKLLDAQRQIDDGRFKESVAASREAVEILRRLSPAKTSLPKDRAQRDLEERRHAMLDALASYVQALFDYDSAAVHSDPHLRKIVWRRGDAVLALTTAAAAAQRVMTDD